MSKRGERFCENKEYETAAIRIDRIKRVMLAKFDEEIIGMTHCPIDDLLGGRNSLENKIDGSGLLKFMEIVKNAGNSIEDEIEASAFERKLSWMDTALGEFEPFPDDPDVADLRNIFRRAMAFPTLHIRFVQFNSRCDAYNKRIKSILDDGRAKIAALEARALAEFMHSRDVNFDVDLVSANVRADVSAIIAVEKLSV